MCSTLAKGVCDAPLIFDRRAMDQEDPPLLRQADGPSGSDNRMFLEAVLWIARTGSPWRDLPAEFGQWNTVFRRCREGRCFQKDF